MTMRRLQSLERRRAAADIAAARPHPIHRANGDEHRHRDENGKPTYIGNFTKCLRHDDNGFLVDPMDYSEWVRSIDSADPRDIAAQTIGGPPWKAPQNNANNIPVRGWESQGAGSTFELEGPDAQSVTIPPAPAELTE